MQSRGYSLDNDTITINRDLNELDLFVKEFLEVLKKHSDYLLVSGYVSISTGRTRGTEDVDLLLPLMEKEKFNTLLDDLQKNNFWCYQSDELEEIYSYLSNMSNIRFARKGEMFPNMEIVPINQSKKIQFFEFTHPQKIRIRDFEFKIPQIEFEIAYKETMLRGTKDIADAKHLRTFFSEIVKEEKIKEYKRFIKETP